MAAIIIKNLTKRFGSYTAVKAVDLTVKEGEIYTLIGANGAGKTTFVKMIVGLLIPTDGTITVCGYDARKYPLTVKRNIGYVPDDPTAYDYLTGLEFLMLTGRLRGMEKDAAKKRIDALIPMFPVGDVLPTVMSQYSRGNKQKVAILAALMTKPKILVIDEPVVGLDPESTDILGEIIRTYAREGNTVLFVTHILSFAKKYADKVGVMEHGVITKETNVTSKTNLDTFL